MKVLMSVCCSLEFNMCKTEVKSGAEKGNRESGSLPAETVIHLRL